MERLSRPIIHGEIKMMSSDRAADGISQTFDGVDCRTCRSMLEDYFQFWKLSMQGNEVWKKMGLRVQNTSILYGI